MKNKNLILILCLIIGIYLLFPLTYQPWQQFMQAQQWEEADCKITEHFVKQENDPLEYRFLFKDYYYKGQKIDLAPADLKRYISKSSLFKQYPLGSMHKCFVNSLNPAQVVLNRQLGWFMLITLIPFLFISIAGWGLWQQAQETAASSQMVSSFYPLKSASSPLNQFMLSILFAGTFSIGCGVIYYQAWLPEYERSLRIPFMSSIFIVIFFLAALLSLLNVLYSFLNLFNPRIILKANSKTFFPGYEYLLIYKIEGNIQMLQSLTVKLICKKIVQPKDEQEAIKNVLEENIYESIIYDNQTELISLQDEIKLVIPPAAKLSSKQKDVEIAWIISFHGHIDRWPDLNNEFRILVTIMS